MLKVNSPDEAVIRLHDIARLIERSYSDSVGVNLAKEIRSVADELNELIKDRDSKN